MGASSSCSLFNAFSSGLNWIGQHKLGIPHIVHILDDFMFLADRNQTFSTGVFDRSLRSVLNMRCSLGMPIKNKTIEQTNTCMTFMELKLD